MSKLWSKKGGKMSKEAEAFTVGKDYLYDQKLVKADCLASIAHAKMLQKIGILSKDEFAKLKKGLVEIIELDKKGKFKIMMKDEDVHTKIENYLTKKYGTVGKKIHTARSRNDQVLTALRLYEKQKLIEISGKLLSLSNTLLAVARKNEFVAMPGYTHMQKAMPSSIGLWASAFAEAFLDDLKVLKAALVLVDQCPLGSAASYGVSIKIDRALTAKLLGFNKVQNNVLYCQNSRGKIEAFVLSALMQVSLDLSKMANDLVLFSASEFGFVELSPEISTGSSIMPQKCNPDVFELLRAKTAEMSGFVVQETCLLLPLPSGYSRDLQLSKQFVFNGLDLAEQCINIAAFTIPKLSWNKKKMLSLVTPELFAADKALGLVVKGIPFRDSYKEVAKGLKNLEDWDVEKNVKAKKHLGAPGNLGLDKLAAEINVEKKGIVILEKRLSTTLRKLEKL